MADETNSEEAVPIDTDGSSPFSDDVNQHSDVEEIEYLPVDTENDESDGTFDDESDPKRKELAEEQRHKDAERGIIGHRPEDDTDAQDDQPESE